MLRNEAREVVFQPQKQGEVSKALMWGTKLKGCPKPSNQDTIILMQYFLKIKTNVKNQKTKRNPHNEQSVTILNRQDPVLAQLSLISLTLIPVLLNPVFKILVFCSSRIFLHF